MKLCTHLAFLMLFALPLFVFAQTSSKLLADSSYKFGSRTIRIPEPDGLVEVVSLYPAMKDRFTDMVGPNYDLIAGFVSKDLIPSVEKGENPDLEFYAKVSVAKSTRAVDVSPEEYARFVSNFEKASPTVFDENGPIIKKAISLGRTRLENRYGQDSGLNITEPRQLGVFDKTPQCYSFMVLMTVEAYGEKIPLLGAASFLYVNKRSFVLMIASVLKDDNGPQKLRDFSKKWTASILEANKQNAGTAARH